MRGFLHYAVHDETMNSFGRNDDSLVELKELASLVLADCGSDFSVLSFESVSS